MFIHCVTIIVVTLGCALAQSDYFIWEKYDRSNTPDDAVVIDSERGPVYLGVVFMVDTENTALIPVNILNNSWYVNVTLGGRSYMQTKNILIARHKNKDAVWKSANQTVFESLFDRGDYAPLQLGWEANARLDYNASIYAGRGPTANGNMVGKIYRGLKGTPFHHEEGILYLDNTAKEVPFQFRGGEYEIAVYLKN